MSDPEHDRDDELLERLRGELLGEEREPERRPRRRRAHAGAGAPGGPRRRRRATPRRRPRRDFLLGAGLASAGAALGVAGFAIVDDDPAAPPTEPISLSGAPTGVRASAELINHTWGVELVLTVSGLRDGSTYDVVYRSASGDVPAGSFVGVGGEQLCRMTGALLARSDRGDRGPRRGGRDGAALDAQLRRVGIARTTSISTTSTATTATTQIRSSNIPCSERTGSLMRIR